MEIEQPNPKKWFARRRVVLFTCCALLVGLIGWLWISRPDSLQRQVEAIGGNHIDMNLEFMLCTSILDWKGVAYALFQQAQGKARHSIAIVLYKTDVTDDWVRRNAAEMKKHPVQLLNFSSTGITDDAVAQLAEMESLGMLYLAGTSITDQSMSAIRKMPNLTYINLMNTSVTADGISQLGDHPSLRNMEITGDVLTDETVTHINAMPRLWSLGLKDFNNDQLSRLGGMKKIHTLSLTAPTDESLPFILRLSQLKYLSLVDSQLSADSVETIREALPNLDIRQHMSIEKAEDLGIYQMLADQRRVKQIVFLVITLVGGSLALFLGFIWRRRQARRRRQHFVSGS